MKQILTVLFLLLLAVAPLSAQTVTQPESITVTITGGGSISTAANLAGCTVAGVVVGTAWTTANIAFTASVDGTNYFAVYDGFGSLVTVSAAADRWIQLSPADTWGFRYVKVASVNTATGAAEAQAATRTLRIICRK